jgi:TolB-like protein/Tfp pilus assembly protein PilF
VTDAPTEREGEGAWAKVRRRKVVQWGLAYAAGAWALLQGLEYITSTFHWPEQFQQLATLALLTGLPIVLIIAWYHGDRGEQRVSGAELTIIVLLLLLAGGFLWHYQRPSEKPAAPGSATGPGTAESRPVLTPAVADARPSVAVLPFENRSAKQDDAFFVDGIHDDILTQLSKVSALKVISRTSVERFRTTELGLQQIAKQLGVSNILEGGVQRAGERVRITVQLIDTATDAHLWAESYDRELTATNIFAIQSEVAGAIAVALRATLTAGESASVNAVPTQSLEAWEAYQRGKQRMARRTSASLAESVEHFQKAIAADPTFALSYVGLADALLIQVFYEYTPRTASLARAEKVIEKALELDPNLAGAHTSLGKLFEYLDDNERAEVEYRRAIELNPNYATAYHWYALLLANEGRLREALRAAEKAEALDPLSAIINNAVAVTLDRQGRFEEALAGYRKALHNDPGMSVVYVNVAALHSYAFGRLDLAAPFLEKAAELDPSDANAPARVGWLYLDLGDDKRAEQWFARALKHGASGVVANDAAAFWHLYRGEQDKALTFARRSYEIEPRRSSGLALLRDADLASGNWQAARTRYAKAFPELLAVTPPRIDGQNYYVAVDLAVVLQQSGELDRANQLLDSSEAFIRTIPRMGQGGYWMTDVQIFALRGQKREALKALREAEKAGWRSSWRYVSDFDPALTSIRSEAEFTAVFADIERDMRRQCTDLAARPRGAPLDLVPAD